MLVIFTVLTDITQTVEVAYVGIVYDMNFVKSVLFVKNSISLLKLMMQQFFHTRQNLFQNLHTEFTLYIIFFVYEKIYFMCEKMYLFFDKINFIPDKNVVKNNSIYHKNSKIMHRNIDILFHTR